MFLFVIIRVIRGVFFLVFLRDRAPLGLRGWLFYFFLEMIRTVAWTPTPSSDKRIAPIPAVSTAEL